MSKLPVVSGSEAVDAFRKIGYVVDRQTGSHIILRRVMPPFRRLSVPNHDPIAKGTLRSIIRQSGLTVDQFRDLL